MASETLSAVSCQELEPHGVRSRVPLTTELPADQYQWDTSQLYSDGIVTLDTVPEPASASLLAIGSLVLLARRRKPHFLGPQESI